MARELIGFDMTPLFVDKDAQNRYAGRPYSPVNPQTGQQITLSVPIADLEDGWDWRGAVANIESFMDGTPPKLPRQQRRAVQRKVTKVKAKAAKRPARR